MHLTRFPKARLQWLLVCWTTTTNFKAAVRNGYSFATKSGAGNRMLQLKSHLRMVYPETSQSTAPIPFVDNPTLDQYLFRELSVGHLASPFQ